jgi:hypothetical protein
MINGVLRVRWSGRRHCLLLLLHHHAVVMAVGLLFFLYFLLHGLFSRFVLVSPPFTGAPRAPIAGTYDYSSQWHWEYFSRLFLRLLSTALSICSLLLVDNSRSMFYTAPHFSRFPFATPSPPRGVVG